MEDNKARYNLTMLHKYLTYQTMKEKSCGLEKAKEYATWKIRNTDNLFGFHGLAWALGAKNFTFFCLYFLQHLYIGPGKAELSKTHFEIWQETEDMILLKKHNQRNFVLTRGFGKTTCISTPVAIWCHVYEYKRYTVIASAIGDTAEEFLKNIKNAILDNPLIEKAFGKLIDPKNFTCNSEKIELTNRTMIQSISASGAIRGKNYGGIRIELLIMDDYQKGDEVATEEARARKWKVFNEDAKNAMQKNNSTMLAVGTLQHKECFYSRLKDSHTWKSRVEKGVLLSDIELDKLFRTGLWEKFHQLLLDKNDDNRLDTAKEFYFQHQEQMQFPLLWSEYWSCLDMALSYYEDRAAFMQEIQNNTDSIGEKKFKSVVTESLEEIESHDFTKTCLVIDPAKTRTKTKIKDFFGFAVCSLGTNKIKYIRKGEIHKFRKDLEYEDYIEHTIFLLRRYPDITHLFIESNTYSGADALKIKELIAMDPKLMYRNIEIEPFHQVQNKDDKINSIVGTVNLGQIVFNEDDAEAIKQLKDFAGCKFSAHDDFPDVVAEACKKIDSMEVIKPTELLDIGMLFNRR